MPCARVASRGIGWGLAAAFQIPSAKRYDLPGGRSAADATVRHRGTAAPDVSIVGGGVCTAEEHPHCFAYCDGDSCTDPYCKPDAFLGNTYADPRFYCYTCSDTDGCR